MPSSDVTVINLIDDQDVTIRLVGEPLEWRVRVVEEVSIDGATTCIRKRSLQVAPLRPLLGRKAPKRATHALIALHVAPMPRGPLLDFDVKGPFGDGWLLPRQEIAERQAGYLRSLATQCGIQVDPEMFALLLELCGFSGEHPGDSPGYTASAFLKDAMGRSVSLPTRVRWHTIALECGDLLKLGVDSPQGKSPPEYPLLAIPELFASGVVHNEEEATALLFRYRDMLKSLNVSAHGPEPTVASDFLRVLADYGHHYDLMVAMRVPLDEPFLVKISERRTIQLSLWGNRGYQDIVIADARTNHVTFRVNDPNVRIAQFEAIRPGTDQYSYGLFQSRTDPQSRSFYAHSQDRDYRIRLRFRLGLLRRFELVPYLVLCILVLLGLALITGAAADVGSLTLVVGPAAIAASILLVREPSTLGSRLRWGSSAALSLGLLFLIGAGVFAYSQLPLADSFQPDGVTPSPPGGPSSPLP